MKSNLLFLFCMLMKFIHLDEDRFKRNFSIVLIMAAPLWQLCFEGKPAEARAALARGEDVNSRCALFLRRTGLMLALMHTQNSIVKLLLEQPTLDLNCTDIYGETGLHIAATYNNVEGLQLLLSDPRLNTANHKNDAIRTPVMYAMYYNSVNALRELVVHPSVNLDTTDEEGRSLEEAARWADNQSLRNEFYHHHWVACPS